MAVSGKMNTAQACTKIAEPVAEELGLMLWDVRFEKEGSGWYLRFFIDKDGGVNIEDCENFSRKIDKVLDDADPIEQSYILEVSSPGIERNLIKPAHFARFTGSLICIRYIRPVGGIKEFQATLLRLDGDYVEISTGTAELLRIKRSDTAYIRLVDNYDYKGD